MRGNVVMTYYQDVMASPVGKLLLKATENGLVSIAFSSDCYELDEARRLDSPGQHRILKQTYNQLSEYFKGKRTTFDLMLHPIGTPFQIAAWRLMIEIPYGGTRSYKEIALALGNSNKARAVGQAANRNPLPIVIPCHRVIGASGGLIGFAGGLDRKAYLLDFEQRRQ